MISALAVTRRFSWTIRFSVPGPPCGTASVCIAMFAARDWTLPLFWWGAISFAVTMAAESSGKMRSLFPQHWQAQNKRRNDVERKEKNDDIYERKKKEDDSEGWRFFQSRIRGFLLFSSLFSPLSSLLYSHFWVHFFFHSWLISIRFLILFVGKDCLVAEIGWFLPCTKWRGRRFESEKILKPSSLCPTIPIISSSFSPFPSIILSSSSSSSYLHNLLHHRHSSEPSSFASFVHQIIHHYHHWHLQISSFSFLRLQSPRCTLFLFYILILITTTMMIVLSSLSLPDNFPKEQNLNYFLFWIFLATLSPRTPL